MYSILCFSFKRSLENILKHYWSGYNKKLLVCVRVCIHTQTNVYIDSRHADAFSVFFYHHQIQIQIHTQLATCRKRLSLPTLISTLRPFTFRPSILKFFYKSALASVSRSLFLRSLPFLLFLRSLPFFLSRPSPSPSPRTQHVTWTSVVQNGVRVPLGVRNRDHKGTWTNKEHIRLTSHIKLSKYFSNILIINHLFLFVY